MLRTLGEAACRASGAYSFAEKCLSNKKTCLKSELREYVLNYYYYYYYFVVVVVVVVWEY
jgi:hypothetical protein